MVTDSDTRPAAGGEAGIRLLAGLHAEIARADNKAGVLVAALGMTAGAFTGLLAGRSWRPADLSAPGAALWWTGVTALTASLLALLMAVLPRYRASQWRPGLIISYFGDIQRAAADGQLARALADTERDPLPGLVAALTETSRITARKHQWIRAGLVAFGAGAVLLPGSLLIG